MIHAKKCERGRHYIDALPCQGCIQEDKDQAAADDKVLAALVRLKAAGKLKEVLG